MNITQVDPQIASFKVVRLETHYTQAAYEFQIPYSHSYVTSYHVTNPEFGHHIIKCDQGEVTPTRLGQYVECLVYNTKYRTEIVPLEVGN